ncbi:ATP-binding cassette domain-containing protein [Streptomyces sundarbansensis]
MNARGQASAVIEAQSIGKSYRTPGRLRLFSRRKAPAIRPARRAMEDVSFRIASGESVALLGLNGAGKSTLIKTICGILRPDEGSLRVVGLDPWAKRRSLASQIGVMFGQRTQLWWDLSAYDSYRVLGEMYGIPGVTLTKRLALMDERLEIAAFWGKPVRHMSLGQRVRCDLAAALLHDPDLLLLDEPTIGMDVPTRDRVRDVLAERGKEPGKSLVLTTHDMSDVAHLCGRLLLMEEGRLVFDDTVTEFLGSMRHRQRVKVSFASSGRPDLSPSFAVLASGDGEAVIGVGDGQEAPDVVARLLDRGDVLSLTVEEVTIDDVLRHRSAAPAIARRTAPC